MSGIGIPFLLTNAPEGEDDEHWTIYIAAAQEKKTDNDYCSSSMERWHSQAN